MKKLYRSVIFTVLALSLLLGSGAAAFSAPSGSPIPDLSKEALPPECYGILTDEYRVFYTRDETGAIIMDQAALKDLQLLLRDEQAMQKVIQDRASARNESVNAFETTAQIEALQNALLPSVQLKTMDRLPSAKLTAVSATKAMSELQNFTHEMYSQRREEPSSSAPGHSPTHIKKILTYAWCWEYEPFWTLTDTVAMAWSSGVHPLTGNDEVGFVYWVNGRQSGKPVSTPSDDFYVLEESYGDNAYTQDIDVDRGLQKEYDIRSVYHHHGVRYIATVHGGLFIVNVVAANPDRANRPITCNGKYYHQKIAVPWSLTIGVDLSIDFGAELGYDSSNTLIRTFYYFDK